MSCLVSCCASARARGAFAAIRQVLAERWPHDQIRFTLIGLASWYLTYSAFRNLKSAVPFVNDTIWDSQMADLDHVIWLGNDPAAVLHNLLGVGWAAAFLSAVYLLWIGLIPASLAWALTWTRNHAVAAWYVTALAFDWVLGVAAYYAFPTLGPIYSRPVDFMSLPESSKALQSTMMTDRFQVLGGPRASDTLQTIAAFPSLHVGMMVTHLPAGALEHAPPPPPPAVLDDAGADRARDPLPRLALLHRRAGRRGRRCAGRLARRRRHGKPTPTILRRPAGARGSLGA